MKKIDILHIYAGTGGSAGLYIDGIYSSLKNRFKQECIVNYYFPFAYGKKKFYKVTEMTGSNLLANSPKLRLIFRMLELIGSFLYAFLFISIKKPKIINYSMTSNLMVEYVFLKLLKMFTNCILIITCHDVLPFQTNYSNINVDIKNRSKFFNLADYLLVHNENSKDDLINHFSISSSKIVSHKFPIMDLNKMERGEKNNRVNTERCMNKLLFVGHMRKEKGLELLITSWKNLDNKNKLSLTIAGNVPAGADFDFDSIKGDNFTLINRFLDDIDFVKLISDSDFVILPYSAGTNSGIPSSIISLGTIPVTSNIPMFLNNDLLKDEFIFESNNNDSLSKMLDYIAALNPEEIKERKKDFHKLLSDYDTQLCIEINALYQAIIEN